MAGTSEATKYSSFPRPITAGGPLRAATILFGSSTAITASANTPLNCPTALRTASSSEGRLPLLLFKHNVILDNPIVHDHDPPRAITVGMSVFFCRTAMGGPAGMADAISAIQRLETNDLFQVA